MFWDAIVLGAGPAGIAAAVSLHRAGKQVLLLDRKQFPRPKACAGMLSASAVSAAPFPLAPVICGISKTLLLRQSAKETLYLERNILTHRIALDTYMHQQAMMTGLPFRQISGLYRLVDTGHSIRLTTQTRALLQARTLIAADGANSTVRRLLAMPPVSRAAFSVEVDLPLAVRAEEAPALFDYDAVAGGYGWWFPKGSSSNLGIAIMEGSSINPAQCLDSFLHKLGQSRLPESTIRGAAIGAYGPYTSPGKGNVLLCGDAAGLADPVTGEGISFAFRSGHAAAQAVFQATQANEAHMIYSRQLKGMLDTLRLRLNPQGSRSFSYAAAAPPD